MFLKEASTDPQSDWMSRVVNLKEIVSENSKKLIIERLGCDGEPSSLKLLTDSCGVCGGDNRTCVDCNGDKDGGTMLQRSVMDSH